MPRQFTLDRVHVSELGTVRLRLQGIPSDDDRAYFGFAYRAGCSVRWNDATNEFVDIYDRSVLPVESLRRVLLGLSDELGIALYTSDMTEWCGVTADDQTQFVFMMPSDTVR
ncbi:MAG: hypothetical protein AAGI53_10390 [Planctomycetota bacterium]